MSVNIINAKLYTDSRPVNSAEKTENSGFDAVVDAAVQKAACCTPPKCCYRVVQPETATVTDAPPSGGVESVEPEAEAVAVSDVAAPAPVEAEKQAGEASVADPEKVEATTTNQEVTYTAMYRFTMFVRISGDFGSLQQSLVDEFKDATRGFVSALKGESHYGIEALDGYLGKAESAAGGGLESSKAFLDEILAAADTGLKAITSSLTSSAWSSGINLSGSSASSLASMFSSSSSSSNSLFSSGLDMAKLQLQTALEGSLKSGNSDAAKTSEYEEMVDYGSGYQLAKVNATPDLKIVKASDNTETEKTVDIAETSGSEATDDSAAEPVSAAGWIVRRDAVLDKFLQLIDSLSNSFGSSAQVVRAGFSFSVDKGISAGHMEGGTAVENADNSGMDAKKEDVETAGAKEEIVV
jgi:hypothetical protein